jgi:hypothetical protein
MSANPVDPFELLKKFWAPLGLPLGMPSGESAGANPLPGIPGMPSMVFPTLDVAEIDKRINDLKTVEGWLTLNLEMVRATVHGFEAQKATLAAFHSMSSAPAAAAAAAAPETSPHKRRAAKKSKP